MQRSQWLAATQLYDPGTSLDEEFVLRLHGAAAQSGGLDLTIGGALLKPLHDVVAAAAEREVTLLLVGVSAGSTVLHFQPEETEVADGHAAPTMDAAVHRIFGLVAAAESALQPEVWSEAEKSFGDLARILDRFDLTADLRWMASTGSVTTSSLTHVGRANVLRWHADVPATPPVQFPIGGWITELKELSDEGVAKIKTPGHKRSKAYEVHFESGQLIEYRLSLGDRVELTVEERSKLTRSGGVSPVHYFVRWETSPSDSEAPS